MIGRTLSHYAITARLGAGGMGEVFCAEDQRLHRRVALKILPEDFSSSPERLARFQREARALAALNHPNIVTVFSIDEVDGLYFLTMELVEGKRLDRAIPRTGLGIDRFFKLALQLTDALAAAHERGIVHRDLKPSNVMVTRNDLVKVLDFGLARLSHDASEGQNQETTALLTSDERVLGTPAFMAPEQVRGERATQQSDIFSLGILLYMMATGRSPFAGKGRIDVMSSILRDQPVMATELRSDLPPHLARLLQRCLEKRPGNRHQSVKDLGFALEELREELSAGEALPSADMIGTLPRRRSWGRLAIIGGIVAAVAVGLGLWGSSRPEWREDEPLLSSPVVTWPSEERAMRISPDGEWLAFLSDRSGASALWIQRATGGEAKPVSGDSRAVISHAWSVAGDEIAMLTQDGADLRLEVVPAPLGGRPTRSLELSESRSIVDWLGDRVLLEGSNGLWSLALETGEVTRVPLAGGAFEFRRHFDLSADGGTVVFSAVRDGRENLWAQTLPDGEPEALTDDDAKQTYPHCLGAACDRVIYLSNRTGQTDVWILDREAGESRQLRVPTKVERLDDAAVDGSTVAVQVIHEGADLWLYDSLRDRHQPLTADSLPDFAPTAAVGTQRIAFQRSRPDTEIHSRFLDARILVGELGAGTLEDVRPITQRGYAPALSPGGRWVSYLETSADAAAPYFTRLWIAEVESGRQTKVTDHFQMNGFSELPASVEADNRLWSGDDELLWVEASGSLVPEIRRLGVAEGSDLAETVYARAAPGQILDLRRSPSGELGFIERDFEGGAWEFRESSPSGAIRTLFSRKVDDGVLRLLGAVDDRWVLVSAAFADAAGQLEVIEVRADGRDRVVATIARATPWTAVLDPGNRRVLASAARGRTSDIVSLDLERGELTVLTDNPLPGVAFCGIRPLEAGGFIYSKQQRNADLWLLRRALPAQTGNL